MATTTATRPAPLDLPTRDDAYLYGYSLPAKIRDKHPDFDDEAVASVALAGAVERIRSEETTLPDHTDEGAVERIVEEGICDAIEDRGAGQRRR